MKKNYNDSPHSSKIHFDVGDKENEQEKRAKIMKFIDELMAGETPVRRFSLKKVTPTKPVTAPGEQFKTLKACQ